MEKFQKKHLEMNKLTILWAFSNLAKAHEKTLLICFDKSYFEILLNCLKSDCFDIAKEALTCVANLTKFNKSDIFLLTKIAYYNTFDILLENFGKFEKNQNCIDLIFQVLSLFFQLGKKLGDLGNLPNSFAVKFVKKGCERILSKDYSLDSCTKKVVDFMKEEIKKINF